MSFFEFRTRCSVALPLLALTCALLAPAAALAGAPNWFTSYPSAEKSKRFKPAAGFVERSISTDYGVGFVSTQVTNDERATKVARLDTTWIASGLRPRDTLRLGDSVNRAGSWGRPLRFGGVQYGTNLRSEPGAIGPAPSASILGHGSVDRALSAGFLRSNYGVEGDEYGPAFASAILRQGIFEHVTAEVYGSAQPEMENGGIALHMRLPGLGVLTAGTAASQSEAGIGRLAQTGFEYSGRGVGLSIGSQWTTSAFRRLGVGEESVAPRSWSAARATFDFARYGILGIGYSALTQYGDALTRIVQGSYQVATGRFNSLTLSFSQTLAPEADTSLMLTYSFPIDFLTRQIRAQKHSWNAMWAFDHAPLARSAFGEDG